MRLVGMCVSDGLVATVEYRHMGQHQHFRHVWHELSCYCKFGFQGLLRLDGVPRNPGFVR